MTRQYFSRVSQKLFMSFWFNIYHDCLIATTYYVIILILFLGSNFFSRIWLLEQIQPEGNVSCTIFIMQCVSVCESVIMFSRMCCLTLLSVCSKINVLWSQRVEKKVYQQQFPDVQIYEAPLNYINEEVQQAGCAKKLLHNARHFLCSIGIR